MSPMAPMVHEAVMAAVLGGPPAVVAYPSAPPPPPIGPPRPPSPTVISSRPLVAPGGVFLKAFERGGVSSASLVLASDRSVSALVLPASQADAFTSGQAVTPIATVTGLAGDSGAFALPDGPLVLACRNTSDQPARIEAAVVDAGRVLGAPVAASVVVHPGERLLYPFDLASLQSAEVLLVSAGVTASVVSPPEAERIAQGGPVVPLIANPLRTSDIPIPVTVRFESSLLLPFDGLGTGRRFVALSNDTRADAGVYLSVRAGEPFFPQPETLPAFNACGLVPNHKNAPAGTFDGAVLRTNDNQFARRFPLVQCASPATNSTPQVFTSLFAFSPLSGATPVRRFRGEQGFNLIGDGQVAVNVRTTATTGDTETYSPTNTVFFVTVDTIPPERPTSPALVPADDRGALDNDGLTSTGTLRFTGRGEPFAKVMLLVNGRAARAPSVTVTPSGDWIASALITTPGLYRVSAVQMDEATNLSERSAAQSVRVVQPPRAPNRLGIARPDRFAVRDGVTIIRPRPTVSGFAAPNATVVLLVNGEEAGRARANPKGAWSVSLGEPLSTEDPSELAAVQLGEGGIESARSSVIRVRAQSVTPVP
jgi:hypothetical protein